MPNLTKSYIDKIERPAKGYKLHWDDKLAGFGIRASTKKLTFVYQGRIRGPGMREVNLSIGSPPVWTVDLARAAARELALNMSKGIDPRIAKRASDAEQITLATVAAEYTSRPGKLKERSKQEINRHIKTTFEKWKDKPIAAITNDMCKRRYKQILTKGLRGDGPAPGQANQAFSILRALINFAMRQHKKADGSPLMTHNPVEVLKDDWVNLKPRDTRIPENKVGEVWNLLTQMREEAYTPAAWSSVDLVMFLILTGARIGEASSLMWKDVNLDEAWWHIPDPKNGNPVWLPLSTQAIALLSTRQRVEGSPYVFPTHRNAGHIGDARGTLQKVSEVAGTKINAHDLRRTFASYSVANCGADIMKIELLTNHVPTGVTAKHYLETSHLQYLQPEVQAFADWMTARASIVLANNGV